MAHLSSPFARLRGVTGGTGSLGPMQIAVLGIDQGKNSCSVVGLDVAGRVGLRRRPHRDG